MARQKGVIKLEGQIGDLSFFKTKEGFQVRERSGVSGERIKNDPAFARTRENGAEFGRAGKASKLLRTAIRTQLLNVADGRLASRLTKEMVKVIHADATNVRGMRNVIDGEAELLKGFEFNQNAHLKRTLFAKSLATIERATGTGRIVIEPYTANEMIIAPGGATHYELLMAVAAVDFQSESYTVASATSGALALNKEAKPELTLEAATEPASAHPIFLFLGITFTQIVNGLHYPLQNGAHNALALVEINGAAD